MSTSAPPFQVDSTDPWYRPDLWAQISELPADLITSDEDKLIALELLEYATFVLHSLTARRYSPMRTVTEIYDSRVSLAYGAEPYPTLINGTFYNACNGCSECCCSHCGVFHRTRLRGQPVRQVTGVWAEGVELLAGQYMVLDNSVLAFTNAEVCNTHCLVVEYVYGAGIPPGGRLAALKLATEMLNYGRGGECELPARVTAVTRQGISWTLLDPQDFLKDGRTGIYTIDLFLRAANPAGALAPAKVFSPDFPRASMITWAPPPASLPLPDAPGIFVPSYQRSFAMTKYSPFVEALTQESPMVTTIDGIGTVDQSWDVSGGTVAVLDLDVETQRRMTAASTVRVVFANDPGIVAMTGPVMFL